MTRRISPIRGGCNQTLLPEVAPSVASDIGCLQLLRFVSLYPNQDSFRFDHLVSDIGDLWERLDQPRYALESSAESVRLGINFFVYAMTH